MFFFLKYYSIFSTFQIDFVINYFNIICFCDFNERWCHYTISFTHTHTHITPLFADWIFCFAIQTNRRAILRFTQLLMVDISLKDYGIKLHIYFFIIKIKSEFDQDLTQTNVVKNVCLNLEYRVDPIDKSLLNTDWHDTICKYSSIFSLITWMYRYNETNIISTKSCLWARKIYFIYYVWASLLLIHLNIYSFPNIDFGQFSYAWTDLSVVHWEMTVRVDRIFSKHNV